MSSRETPVFELDDYPLNRAGGRMELLDAETIYFWEEHYWLAVLKVRSTFGQGQSRTSVRIYRWQWKADREGNERWMLDQKHTINKRDMWKKTATIVERMLSTI